MKEEIVKILKEHEGKTYSEVAEEIAKLFVVNAVAPLENHLPSCDCICCKPELWKKDDRGIWYQSIGDDVV